jgi:hypothetical protein
MLAMGPCRSRGGASFYFDVNARGVPYLEALFLTIFATLRRENQRVYDLLKLLECCSVSIIGGGDGRLSGRR